MDCGSGREGCCYVTRDRIEPSGYLKLHPRAFRRAPGSTRPARVTGALDPDAQIGVVGDIPGLNFAERLLGKDKCFRYRRVRPRGDLGSALHQACCEGYRMPRRRALAVCVAQDMSGVDGRVGDVAQTDFGNVGGGVVAR